MDNQQLQKRIEALEKQMASLNQSSTITYQVENALQGRGFVNIQIVTDPTQKSGTFSVTIASPAVFTTAGNHGLQENQTVYFTTTGALPTGLTALQEYYVIATGLTATQFQVSDTLGGAAVDTTGTQSGVHTFTSIGFSDFAPVFFGLLQNKSNNMPDLFIPLYSISELG